MVNMCKFASAIVSFLLAGSISTVTNKACFEDFLIVVVRLLLRLPAPCKGGESV